MICDNLIDVDGRQVAGSYHRCSYCGIEWVNQFEPQMPDDCGICEKTETEARRNAVSDR